MSELDKLRFYSRVAKEKDPHVCKIWLGSDRGKGYGGFKLKGSTFLATRIAYFLATGKDPGSKFVCHSCNNPPCCNDNHLYLATQSRNMMHCSRSGRLVTPIIKVEYLDPDEVDAVRGADYKVSQRTLAARFKVPRYVIQTILEEGRK